MFENDNYNNTPCLISGQLGLSEHI